jgi:two-component system sensor histidine kinase BaeS
LLAYILGRPLKRITAASKSLAIGCYDARLPIDSHDELGQLARHFNDLAAALEQAEQTRRRWVADISHELRTPLSVLRGELEALQDGIRPLTREAIDSLYGDVMRLNRLAEDLYQLSLSDQGALSYRKTKTYPLDILKEDLNAFAPEFERRDISVTLDNQLDDALNLHADPDRLSQLYRNLLKNTMNYTDNGGRLLIRVSCHAEKLELSFQDSAPGVPEQELPKLFDRFYRLESSRNRSHGGAGLGLAICRNIVEAHNGTIYALASSWGGLDIKVELPLEL